MSRAGDKCIARSRTDAQIQPRNHLATESAYQIISSRSPRLSGRLFSGSNNKAPRKVM